MTAATSAAVADAMCQCSRADPEPPKIEPCRHRGLHVQCSHGRSVFASEETRGTRPILQVVAGVDLAPDKITAITEIVLGPCSSGMNGTLPHKTRVFDLDARGQEAERIESQSDTQLVFKAQASPLWDTPLLFFWPKGLPTFSHFVHVNTCWGLPLEAEVQAILDLKWEAVFSLDIKTVKKKAKDSFFSGWLGEDVAWVQEFNPKGYIKASWNGGGEKGEKFELSAEKPQSWTKIFRVVQTAAEVGDFIQKSVADRLGIEVDTRFPSFKLSGDWGWKEIPGSPKCDFAHSATIGFEPLIGATVSADILEFILKKWPGVGDVLVDLKKKAAAGKAAKMEAKVVLSLAGDLKGTGTFTKTAGGAASGEGKLEGTIVAKVEGTIAAEGEIFIVKASAKASLSAEAGLKGDVALGVDDPGIYGQGSLGFTGLVVKALVQAGLDIKKSTAPPDPSLNPYASPGTSEAVSDSGVKPTGGGTHDFVNKEWELIEKVDWWTGEKTYFLN